MAVQVTMAEAILAVAYLMEVQWDRCKIRKKLKRFGTLTRIPLKHLERGEPMSIKWSALRISEAMDMVEEFVNQANEPLEQAKIVASEARNIANLPQYLDQRLVHLIFDIERIDYIQNSINAVRNELPDGAVEAEKKSESHGRQPVPVS
ncbi:hypothetical protein ACFLWG_02780 [Chloroflexota bacterium]